MSRLYKRLTHWNNQKHLTETLTREVYLTFALYLNLYLHCKMLSIDFMFGSPPVLWAPVEMKLFHSVFTRKASTGYPLLSTS